MCFCLDDVVDGQENLIQSEDEGYALYLFPCINIIPWVVSLMQSDAMYGVTSSLFHASVCIKDRHKQNPKNSAGIAVATSLPDMF